MISDRPPPRKDPQKRTVSPISPPNARSRAALGLTAAAAEGRFALQVCSRCQSVQYPPRDACVSCLSTTLPWQDVDPKGVLLAQTTLRTSVNLYFKERGNWRVGTVQLDAGPSVVCHVHAACAPRARVRLINRLDRAAQGVLIAMPEEGKYAMTDDPQLQAMTSTPRHRRVLISDARNPNSPALASAVLAAGAVSVFVGESESWRPYPQRAALEALEGVEILPLDVTDTSSVQKLAAEIGGKTDILINNAQFLRPGGVMARGDTTFAAQEMEVNVLGLMRLAQAFGPGMCARTADGANSAVAWVNLLSVHALSNLPAYGCFAASHAAARSVAQNLRADFAAAGLRVMNVYAGPPDDDWHQPVPPPKVTPNALARSVVQGLNEGLEDVFCGDVARDLMERFRDNPNQLEREITAGGGAP